MLDLRRLRLLRELHDRGHDRRRRRRAPVHALGGLAAARDARARDRRPLLERAGRGVRLTDAALVLVEHAEALLERAALAEADLAAAPARSPAAPYRRLPVRARCASPPGHGGAGARRRRGCAASSSSPSPSTRCPALALGDIDLVLADEWQHQPRGCRRRRPPRAAARPGRPRPAGGPPAARRHRARSRSPSCATSPGRAGHPAMGWEEMTQRTCRALGGFEPDVRHRTNDAPSASRSSPAASPSRCCPSCRSRPPPGSRRRSPRRPCTARSSPPPAPPTPPARRRARCWRRSAKRPRPS